MTSINARVDVVKFFSDRNPKVDQNIFEDISALIRSRDEAPIMTLMCVDSFVVHGAPGTLSTFEQAFFGPFTVIDRQCALLFRVRVPHTHDPSQNTFHTVSNARTNAVAAHHRRPDRIPRATALFAHPRLLATKGEHSWSRKTVAAVFGAGRDVGDCAAVIGAEQDKRRVGIRVAGGRRSGRGSVSAIRWGWWVVLTRSTGRS